MKTKEPVIEETKESAIEEKETIVEEKEEPKKKEVEKLSFEKYKHELKAEREEKEKLSRKIQEMEEKSLQEKNNFRELYEREKAKRVEIETEIEKKNELFYNTLKRTTIKDFAKKYGLIDHAIDDLDRIEIDPVEIETTSTGGLNVIGAKEFVEDLKGKKPHWFSEGKININNGNPIYKNKDLNGKDLLDLQKKDPLKYKE